MNNEPATLRKLIRAQAPRLDLAGTDFRPELVLAALLCVETHFWDEKWRRPRVEAAYLPGGPYYRRSLAVRTAYQTYGEAAAASWGPWQLMYPTAYELGFRGRPQDLTDAAVSLPYVVEYLNRRVFCWTPLELGDIADGYNSGSCVDQIVPRDYIKKFIRAYEHEARDWLEEV
jgi:hypothetical protein